MTNGLRDQSCGSPNLSYRLSGHQIRRLEEGVGKRERHSDVALLSRTFISRRIHSLRPSKTERERRRHLESAAAAAARGGRERAEIGFPMSHNPPHTPNPHEGEEMI